MFQGVKPPIMIVVNLGVFVDYAYQDTREQLGRLPIQMSLIRDKLGGTAAGRAYSTRNLRISEIAT